MTANSGARIQSGPGRSSRTLPLSERLVVLAAALLTLWALKWVISGTPVIQPGGETAWLACALGLWTVEALGGSFFARPRDALANSLGSTLILMTLEVPVADPLGMPLRILQVTGLALSICVGVLAVVAIVLHERSRKGDGGGPAGGYAAYRVATTLGRGELIYSIPALASIIGFYSNDQLQMTLFLLLWTAIASLRPVEAATSIWAVLKVRAERRLPSAVLGRVLRVDAPNVVRVSLSRPSSWAPDGRAVVCLADGATVEVQPLYVQVQAEGVVGTGLCGAAIAEDLRTFSPGLAYDATEGGGETGRLGPARRPLGLIVEGSSTAEILFEVGPGQELEVGAIVQTHIGGVPTLYQIVDARVQEEVFSGNPRGCLVAHAMQLGWPSKDGHFERSGWVPEPNAPVFAYAGQTPGATDLSVGDDVVELGLIPGTDLSVRARLDHAIEFHTAILGSTGTGKTELALDLVRQALARGGKVFCVDFTGEYEHRLSDCEPTSLGLPDEEARELGERLFAVETGNYGAKDEKRDLQVFVDDIRPKIQKRVDTFLTEEGAGIGILSLPEITNTKATLRATELYLSSIFEWARNHRRLRQILVVLEEAHTVIPETSWSGFDGDTTWVVNRIGQIALQGRKYGVGLLIVSQRTALVSKTLLSQCNTCIAFGMQDRTGLNYLETVFGSEHVKAVARLRAREAVAFGKAVLSDGPVLLSIPFDEEKAAASRALDMTDLERGGEDGPEEMEIASSDGASPEAVGDLPDALDEEVPF